VGNLSSIISSGPRPIVGVLWKRRYLIAGAAVVCVMLGFIYLAVAKPQYQSTAKLYIQSRSPRIISNVDGFRAESTNFLSTQAALIKSAPILERAVQMPEVKQLRTIAGKKSPKAFLRKSLTVSVGEHQDIVNVTCRSSRREDAAVLANAVADAYVDFQNSKQRTTAGEVVRILQQEKSKREAELRDVLERMLEFRKRHKGSLFEGGGVNIELTRLAKLSEALTSAELSTIEAKSKLRSAEELKEDPEKVPLFMAALRSRGYYLPVDREESRLREELNTLKMQLVERMGETTAEAPATVAAQKQIKQLREQLTERQLGIAEACLAAARQEYDQATAKEQALRDAYKKQEALVQDLGVKSTEFDILKSELDRTEHLLAALDNRIKEIDIAEDTGAMHIMILEKAEPASAPFRPNKKMTLAVALALGLIFGAAGALVWEGIGDLRYASAPTVPSLNAPVLGEVARSPSRSEKHREVGRWMLWDHKSKEFEGYRRVCAALQFSPALEGAACLLFTSAQADAGTSGVLGNLAVGLAHAGRNVLVCDCNFREPVQHKIFQVPAKAGLAEVLAGRAQLEDCIADTDVSNLHVLPWGTSTDEPSELVAGEKLQQIFANLSQRYDRVLVDSPALSEAPDTLLLAACCEKTVFVVRPDESAKGALDQAYDALQTLGKRIDGVILNGVA